MPCVRAWRRALRERSRADDPRSFVRRARQVTRPEILKILAQESLDACVSFVLLRLQPPALTPVARSRLLPPTSVQPVPILELSETLADGAVYNRFLSDEDQRAIRKGRKFILFDDSMIVIEGDDDGDGRVRTVPPRSDSRWSGADPRTFSSPLAPQNQNIFYSVIGELEVDEGRSGKGACSRECDAHVARG